MASTNSVSYGYINDTISTGISAFESKLRSTMTSMADNTDGALTSAQMLQMQQQVQQWTIMVEIQSTITSSWRTRSSPWCRNRAETHAARPATAPSRATARVGVGFRVGY